MVTKVLTTDSIQTTDHAINFDADNETWIIDPGILAYSQDVVGVYSNGFANNTLINYGNVEAVHPDETGVFLNDGSAVVTNEAGAEIFGSLRGVFLNGGGKSVVNNFGTIIGASNAGDFGGTPPGISAGVEFYENTLGVLLNNSGYIFGDDVGVYNFSDNSGGTINNHKTIRSDGDGILTNTESSFTTNITNFAGATVMGSNFSLVADTPVSLINQGTMVGQIDTLEHAVIVNHGVINGSVTLEDANDTFNGAGGKSGAIFAGGGNDRIIAGKGNVQIHVGGGNDTLTGGPGHDQFIFDSSLAGQVEKITNFSPALDKIVLSETDFAGIGTIGLPLATADFHIGPHATTGSQHIIYNANSGFLFYDPDGTGPDPQVHFATVSPHLALTHADFIVEA